MVVAGAVCCFCVFCQRAAVQVGSTVAATRERDPLEQPALSRLGSRSRLSPHPVTAVGRIQIAQIVCWLFICGLRAAARRPRDREMPLCAPGVVARSRGAGGGAVSTFKYTVYQLIPGQLDRDPSFYLILNLVWPAGGGPSATLPCPS